MFKPSLAIALLSGTLVSLSAQAGVEEDRLPAANEKMPQVVQRYHALTDDLVTKYRQHTDELKVTQMVAHQGQRLWQQAVRDVQSGHSDDRSLYWSRLQMRAELGKQSPKFNIASWQREILTKAVEKSSRGFSDIDFKDDASIKILLTGFDPFFLDRNIEQSNPSGLVALALDGYRFSVNGRQAQIETVMIPVRFADFDEGIIESLLTPVYRDKSVDMVVTVSMGRSDFDLERFPGRNRSAEAPDNRNVFTGASKQRPLPPKLENDTLKGPEFVEFSLPVAAMQSVNGRWKTNDNHTVSTLSRGEFQASSLSELQNSTSVEGSGGGYLSNEISYRAILLQNQLGSRIPTGHIHTPRIAGFEPATEEAIVEQVKAMLTAAAKSL
ncbi:hypothetical protein [Shewanella algae]|jgi:pyrrolidone-carboxylate peptidase|uniref:pyroglutamyl-peptidase I family protein n=1 Tax=Shewanella algae TaxID=38313 RepID=UPI001AADE192|nr:hypothetical protein [Shewanella algae]MBO2553889.1 hypothetical protein [Shewanella algae]MBO2598132.1 hypothetical protein [Shewanella algae]BCV26893.1 hypothetical protein TUM3811_07530 [Shewanella algae]HDS1213376.1 hypothetical protein [Shewanella algae]HDS1213625.1 hypothetical protein [Shewanella algae]